MATLHRYLLPLVAAALIAGCGAQYHARDVRAADQEDRLTVGTVQKTIRVGMSAADVAQVLGSPNIVTTDQERLETWIYDKISSDVTYSRSEGTIVGMIVGNSAAGAGIGTASAGATSTSQRTLTVIIRFDAEDRVRDFSYHASRF
jgi:outer membrane protein assembly factor BamE (lipoprotein component of BamABCDE complex)